MSTRRVFLRQCAAGTLVSLAGMPPAFLSRAAQSADQNGANSDNGRILVLIQLAGGNDGLNTVVPYSEDAYHRARPGIRIPDGAVLKIDDQLGLHPAMTGFKKLYDEGRLAIVQGVGYANPNRSHFRSTDIWESARPDIEYTRDGWLGRALDATAERDAAAASALAFGMENLPLALVSGKVNVPTVKSLEGYQFHPGPGSASDQALFRSALSDLIAMPAHGSDDLEFLKQTTQTALASAQRLKEVTSGYEPAAGYPYNRLGNQLKIVAQMIAGDLGTRVFFLTLGGFDTHARQQPAHQALLTELSSAILAFFSDLKGHGLDDRVLLATFSEFGRRVQENGSLGTDHGAASQLFVVTSEGHGGVYGQHPSLTDLYQGDLKFHTDFRRVYATILDRWLGIPSERVLGEGFESVGFC